MDTRFNRNGPSPLRHALNKLHTRVKKNKYVSRGLDAFGFPRLAAGAKLLGYGQRRKTVRRRRMRGGTERNYRAALAPLTQSRVKRLLNQGIGFAKKH